ANYHRLTVLEKAGLATHDVTLDYLQPAEGLTALASHKVDAWDVWTAFIEQARQQDHARVLVNGKGFGTPYSFTVASRPALADPAKAAAIRVYLKLLNRAHKWADAHPRGWAGVWQKGTGLPDSIMATAARDAAATAVPV